MSSWIIAIAYHGPSPRVWGLRPRLSASSRRLRSIPTRVGTTLSIVPQAVAMRSIPTRVGTTSRPQRRGRIRAVHPHACGDYRVYRWVAGTENGPSPRVWGLRAGHAGPRGPGRSIPTRVGTTRSPPAARPYPPVHPHACGDYRWVGHSLRHLSGPFPRVWGLQLGGILASYRGRSIPTRVGTTPGPAFSHSVGEVHPHACGDYVAVHRVTVNQRGPSPRVWGLRSGPE